MFLVGLNTCETLTAGSSSCSGTSGGRGGSGKLNRSVFTLLLLLWLLWLLLLLLVSLLRLVFFVAAVTLSFRGGKGNGGSSRGVYAAAAGSGSSSSIPGGGAGSAFENRDRPPGLGGWRVVVGAREFITGEFSLYLSGETGELGGLGRSVVILNRHQSWARLAVSRGADSQIGTLYSCLRVFP